MEVSRLKLRHSSSESSSKKRLHRRGEGGDVSVMSSRFSMTVHNVFLEDAIQGNGWIGDAALRS